MVIKETSRKPKRKNGRISIQRAPIYMLMAFAGIFLLLVLIGGSEAKTITVDDSGGADYSSIQNAVNNATEGDTIRVFEGK